MSPKIFPVPTIDPSHEEGRAETVGGTISATGLPKRVTRTGLCVLRTCSKTDKHVALNLEIAISSIASPFTKVDHGQ